MYPPEGQGGRESIIISQTTLLIGLPMALNALRQMFARVPGLRRKRVQIWMILVSCLTVLLIFQGLYPDYSPVPVLESGHIWSMAAIIFLAALLCEMIDSGIGMGYGTTLTPILLIVGFKPLDVVPCVLLSELVTGIFATLMHHYDGNVNFVKDKQARSTAMWLGLLSVVGVLMAVTLALHIPGMWLKAIIGVIVLSIGVTLLVTLKRRFRYRRGHLITIGAVAAFNKGLSGGGYGPLVCAGQVVSGVSPKNAVAITSLTESFTCAVGLGAYLLANGKLAVGLAIPLTLGAVCSVPIATLMIRRLPDHFIRGAVGLATFLLGLFMLWQVVR
jgi:uncharacterized protein